MKPEATSQHAWLQKLVGEWTFDTECIMGPDQPPMKTAGTESVRSLGGLWVLCEGQGGTPDGDSCRMVITLGFDPDKGKFVGTFVASMMTMMWLYEGQLDAAGRVLTLDTLGPRMDDPTKTCRYQDVIEIVGDDERTLRSQLMGDDGKWVRFMTAKYRRVR